MKITLHVPSADDIADARVQAEATMREGDELEIVVAQPASPMPAERQPARPAGGASAGMGGS